VLENFLHCCLELRPKRGITFDLPSVLKKESVMQKRIASIVAYAAIAGTVKAW
jgi:hypothetical protein